MADTYTHKDLANLCGVSETTIKSYRRKFPGFIPVLTRGKPIRFKSEASAVCLKIRDCFDKGMSVNETHKVLKESFKEDPSKMPPRVTASPEASGVVSQEYLKKFFETAGQMMQGMAGLATAQVKAGLRLEKVEKTLERLVEIEIENSELFRQLLAQKQTPISEVPPATPQTPTEPGSGAEATASESQVRARKIVNVRNSEGDVQSYAFEKNEPKAALERPSDAFLNTPIVIKNDQGEFLGVPGRLGLASFIAILVREAEEGGASLSSWNRRDEAWVFTMQTPNGDSHELFFNSTTTPRGNLVVLLDRLDVNKKKTTPQFLQEFFRQVKDKI